MHLPIWFWVNVWIVPLSMDNSVFSFFPGYLVALVILYWVHVEITLYFSFHKICIQDDKGDLSQTRDGQENLTEGHQGHQSDLSMEWVSECVHWYRVKAEVKWGWAKDKKQKTSVHSHFYVLFPVVKWKCITYRNTSRLFRINKQKHPGQIIL